MKSCNNSCTQIWTTQLLASCLFFVRALLEYVIIIMWLRSVIKMLRFVKFAEYKVLTFIIPVKNAKIVQL